jgi:hypothetical protein
MKKTLKIIVIVLVAGFAAIQFVRPDMTNPPVIEAETLAASTALPDDVKNILARSCADCHSQTTNYPWYSYIQPSAWFLADHIAEGRRELNFSIWNTYAPDRKRRKLDEICEQVRSREMPLPSYLWLHGEARLTDAEIRVLCEWTARETEKISATNP